MRISSRFLSSIRRLSAAEVVDKVEELQPPAVGPATRLYRSPTAGERPAPEPVQAELSGMLAIRRAGLPPSLLASLKHLASLHNAEFYEKQRMGFSVWKTPLFLRCYEETLEHIHLPRGGLDQAKFELSQPQRSVKPPGLRQRRSNAPTQRLRRSRVPTKRTLSDLPSAATQPCELRRAHADDQSDGSRGVRRILGLAVGPAPQRS